MLVRKVPSPNLLPPPVSFCLVGIWSMACPISQLITAETSSSRWLPVRCYSCPSWLLFAHTESHLPFFKPLIHRHRLVSFQTSRCISDRFPSEWHCQILVAFFFVLNTRRTRPQTQTPTKRPALRLDCVFSAFSASTSLGRVSLYLAQILALCHEGAAPAMFCLLYTSPSPRDKRQSRMPSSA